MRSRSKNYLRIAIFFLKKVAKREARLKVEIFDMVYKLEDIKNENPPREDIKNERSPQIRKL